MLHSYDYEIKYQKENALLTMPTQTCDIFSFTVIWFNRCRLILKHYLLAGNTTTQTLNGMLKVSKKLMSMFEVLQKYLISNA